MKTLTVMALALALVACGSDESSDGAKDAVEERAPTVGKEIADNYNRAMDKAREVEEKAMEQKRKIDAALKEAEGDT